MDAANIIRLDRARWPWDRYSRHWLSEQGGPAQQRRLLRARKEIASSGVWLALNATRDVWGPVDMDAAAGECDRAGAAAPSVEAAPRAERRSSVEDARGEDHEA